MVRILLILAPLVVVMLVAVLSAVAIGRRFGMPAETGRLVSLDGLRGYLALGVFVHHAMMWHGYVPPPHSWIPEHPIRLYTHAGESAVTVFFMMTGFLFSAKLAQGRERPIDWQRLYVSRVFRIYPLFCIVFAATLIITVTAAGGRIIVPPATFARSLLSWAHFGRPALDGMAATWSITSGVTWSLEYEWLFYAALPLIAPVFGARAPARWVITAAIATFVWAYWISNEPSPPFHWEHLGAFGAGALASVITRPVRVRAALAGPLAAIVAIIAAALVPLCFDEPYQWPVLALLAIAFVVVASGNTIFGLLRFPASRLLGEISYSIYLLHGLLLFSVLHAVFGMSTIATLSPVAYWGLIVALTPVLVAVAFTTFRLVERPAIQVTPHVQRWLIERQQQNARLGWIFLARRATNVRP